MRLSSLVNGLPPELAPTSPSALDSSDPLIRGIEYDSRKISPGDLFVALSGSAVDGHAYIQQALELGAVAVLVEKGAEDLAPYEAVAVKVPDTRRALASVATTFFGEPAKDLTMVGITGTNGKTSTSYMAEAILTAAGLETGLIGTVEIRYGRERIGATNTTPESLDLQRTLRSMATKGISATVIEVSSHGLELGRVSGCQFRVAAFTNLTQDHLDFHGDMKSYLASKLILFKDLLDSDSHAVINIDDPYAHEVTQAAHSAGANILRCSRNPKANAEITLMRSESRLSGTSAEISIRGQQIDIELPLVGDFHLENLLVACGIGVALGLPVEKIQHGISACPQVPGRMERVPEPRENMPTVIVDYAHTPDAIAKLLEAVRPLCTGRLITVFGCGGDRDSTKRPLMAAAVALGTDMAILTSDNPRTEDPQKILREIESGLGALAKWGTEDLVEMDSSYTVIPNRKEAIHSAIRMARAEDTVVLAGKGHEDYQIIGTRKLPFDDRREAAQALSNRKKK